MFARRRVIPAVTAGHVIGYLDDDRAWVEDALCAQTDPEVFFPEKGGSSATAKSVCRRCLVREDCLQDALDNDEFGIWGGTSRPEREALRQRRKRSHRAQPATAERRAS